MLNDKDTDTLFRIVNENSDYYHIGEYIITKFNVNIDMITAKKIAEMISKEGYTKEQILNGIADKSIKNVLNFYKLRSNSVVQKNERVQDVPLKTKKSKINKKFVVAAIIAIISLSYIFNIKTTITEYKENKEISNAIGMMAAESESEDYNYKRNIVVQNTYRAGMDERGYPVVAYHNDGIAKDIIEVCTQNPELFDLCMYNVYFNMNYNRLVNMDDVVRYLNIYTESDESLSFIQDKLHNCDVFLEYLIARGFANPNDKYYYQLLEDIKTYKLSTADVPFNTLEKDAQKRIEELIEEFKNNRSNLLKEYKDNLEEVKGEDYGTRA